MSLNIHFLNVGHGDCTILEFPSGRLMMIDINNVRKLPPSDVDALATAEGLSVLEFKSRDISLTAASSRARGQSWEEYYESLLVDPLEFFQENFAGRSLFRYVQTHPDMDHMSGLWRFFFEENTPIVNFWDTEHNKENSKEDFERSPYDWGDWVAYKALGHKMAGSPIVEDNHKVLHKVRGDTGDWWSADGVEILAPTTELVNWANEHEDYNEISYVLSVTHAGRRVILPGDAEYYSWSLLADYYGSDLNCDLLKASHHGRESGFHEEAYRLMGPEAVICSVGKKPSTDASEKYARASKVFSTRFHGTLTVTIWDDGDLWIKDRNGAILHRME